MFFKEKIKQTERQLTVPPAKLLLFLRSELVACRPRVAALKRLDLTPAFPLFELSDLLWQKSSSGTTTKSGRGAVSLGSQGSSVICLFYQYEE